MEKGAATAKVEMTVAPTETVRSVKEKVAAAQLIAFPEHKLVCGGEKLDEKKTMGDCGVTEASAVEFVLEATEESVVTQLKELLKSRDLTCDELGLLYCYKHGVSTNQALKTIGIEIKLADFIKDRKEFVLEGGKISMVRDDTSLKPLSVADQLEQILHLPLLNFVFHLHYEKKQVFCEWVILNQATVEELGDECGGLREITKNKDDILYQELEKNFKPGFLLMSDKDELSLDVHRRAFKEEKRRYLIVTFALKTFAEEIANWRPAHAAIQYLRDRSNNKKREDSSLDSLLNDLIKVYVLNSLTMTMEMVLRQQGEQAVRILTGASIAVYQFLRAKEDAAIVKQAIKYTERIIEVVKRSPAVAQLKQAFELTLNKMKKPDKLERTDFI